MKGKPSTITPRRWWRGVIGLKVYGEAMKGTRHDKRFARVVAAIPV
jgi:hypothetical protein